ncbi:MAG: CoA pyrophosphatase [Bacteroidales bacterium]|nr:CoA pyrophosphatase [Bacteroidales bacterium]
MNISISHIESCLQKPLLGWEGQRLLAPDFREEEILRMKQQMAFAKQSAVLILLYENHGKWTIPFIKRASYDGIHSGQISLPGGKKEEKDIDFLQTALRETQEELGISTENVRILGQLSDLYIPPSNFIVKVFVGYCSNLDTFRPDSVEVASVIEIALDDFFAKDIINRKAFYRSSDGKEKTAPYYDLSGVELWGATAMILSEFVEMIRQ